MAWVQFTCLPAVLHLMLKCSSCTGRSAPSLSLLVNELWSVLPSPKGVEDGVADPATSFPSSSHSPRPRVMWKEQDSHSASTVALAGSTLSDTSYR